MLFKYYMINSRVVLLSFHPFQMWASFSFSSSSIRQIQEKNLQYTNILKIVSVRYKCCPHVHHNRMVVHGQLVEPAVCLSNLYDVFLLDIVRDTKQNLWTMIYRSQ